jgi:hypothetical protein
MIITVDSNEQTKNLFAPLVKKPFIQSVQSANALNHSGKEFLLIF